MGKSSDKKFRYKRPKTEYTNCMKCGEELTNMNWSESQQKYKRFICMPCWTKRQKVYAAKLTLEQKLAARNKYNEQRRNWTPERKEKNRQRCYNNWLRKKYGISLSDFNAMFIAQEGKCSICKTIKNIKGKELHVDHCHISGQVRALLCAQCNMMLGLAKDSTNILNNAIEYINFHEARKIAGGKQF